MNNSQKATPDPDLAALTNEADSAEIEVVGEALSSKIADFLRACWVSRRMVLGILTAGILVSLLYAFTLPSVYTSTTTLMPSGNTSPYAAMLDTVSGGNAAAGLASSALGLENPGDLFISILASRNAQDGLINKLDLTRYYNTHGMEDTRRSLAGDTKIEEDRKTGIITISVTADNPVFASRMAQGYVEELNRVITESSTFAARRERIFLEGQVKEIKQQLDESAKLLSQFSTKSGAIDMPSQAKSMVEQGLRLQAELIDGRSQLAALQQSYSEDNFRVRALEAHNAELQRQLDKMGGLPQGSGANANTNKSPYPPAVELPALGLTYYDLERKVRVQEALWEAFTKQYEAAKVEEAAEIPAVRVLDVANVPERKSAPLRRAIVKIGAIISLALGIIAVFILKLWEEMDAQVEPKRLIIEAAGYALNSERRFWKLPGMGRLRTRLKGAE